MAKPTKVKVIVKESLIDDVSTKLIEFEESEIIARKVLNIKKTVALEDNQCKQVMSHALTHYTAVVMDGVNIIKEKYDADDFDALFKIVSAQFSIKK